MIFVFTGKNVEIKPAVREYVMKKYTKIGKFFYSEPETNVTISMQRKMHIIEVTMKFKGFLFRAEESCDDIYKAVDKTVDVIERQIRKNRTKLEKRFYDGAKKFNLEEVQEDIDEAADFKIIRKKTINSKPMDAEEAILQMNLLGHEFFIFTNPVTEQINVVYKRKDGNYGVIEPEK